MEAGVIREEGSKGGGIGCEETLVRKKVNGIGKEMQVGNKADVVRPEEEESHTTDDLRTRSAESRRKEEEAKLKAFGAVCATEEEILKEEQPARGKECDKPTPHNSENMLPHAHSLLNTSTSPSSETTATEEDSLEDLTNELQGKSRYPIAFGGFGDIWKCDLVKPSGTIQVAVKTIRSFESDNEKLTLKNAKRVRRELKVWGRLKHHSILPLYGVANDFGPHPAMICPWAENGALTDFLERQQDVLSSRDKFSLLNDIALGLQYLHNESVVHGDLTGSNVLIYADGRACLADFGLSTIVLEFVGTSYFTSSIRGNVRWVAAELCEAPEDNEISLSTECDIYSFGSITLQVLTCKVPYYNVKNNILVLGQVIKGKKPELPKESQIAPGHWKFIQQCWLPRASRPSVGEIVAFVECERQALLNSSTEI
jgi:serine/threonine protein kinase